MSVLTPERSLPAMLGAAVFSAGLLASLFGAPHHAHAAIGCRTDPIVTLSNGLVPFAGNGSASSVSRFEESSRTL